MFEFLEDISISPFALLGAALGFIIGVVMLKYGGLQGLGILGTAGMVVGSTIGGFIAGAWMFRDN